VGCAGGTAANEACAKKTRPPAQYNARRPCQPPDIEIGSRHPVSAHCPGNAPVNVIQFTIGAKNVGGQLLAEDARNFGIISFWLAVLTDFAVGATSPSLTVRYSDGYLTGSPGPLSSGGCGRASPVVPGGRSLLVCLVSTRWMVVANAAIIATARTAAKIAKVICVRRRLLQLRSLFMGNTFSNMNQRNPLEPVPLLPPSSSGLVPPSSRAARAAEFSRKHIPAATASHHTFAPAPEHGTLLSQVRPGRHLL